MGIVAVVVVIGVVVIIVVIIIVMVVGGGGVVAAAILGNACLAQRNQAGGLVPVANALDLRAVVVVVHAVAVVGDADDGAADVPAAIGDIVTLELGAGGDIAHEHETGESQQLVNTHDDGCKGRCLVKRKLYGVEIWERLIVRFGVDRFV